MRWLTALVFLCLLPVGTPAQEREQRDVAQVEVYWEWEYHLASKKKPSNPAPVNPVNPVGPEPLPGTPDYPPAPMPSGGSCSSGSCGVSSSMRSSGGIFRRRR